MSNFELSPSEEHFELKLFQSMKLYGYLFPSSLKAIDEFEHLYGDTEIEMPTHLENLDDLLAHNPHQRLGGTLKMAAFSASKKGRFDIPKDISDSSDEKDESNEQKPE